MNKKKALKAEGGLGSYLPSMIHDDLALVQQQKGLKEWNKENKSEQFLSNHLLNFAFIIDIMAPL